MDATAELKRRLEQLNDVLKGVFPFRLEIFKPAELKLLDKNARFMRNDTFQQLVRNIKRDKALSSVPLVYRSDDGSSPVVLSGNHRVAASVEAGVDQILCLVIDSPRTEEERLAIQLSHNALVGQDDLPTLKTLYDGIADLSLKAYSGIDEE